MLELFDKYLLITHIAAGTLSLLLFWTPVLSKKGSKVHRRSGHFYYITMWIVQGTAIILSVINAWNGDMISASFLGFLALLTISPLYYSRAVLYQVKGYSNSYLMIRSGLAILLVIASVAMIIASFSYSFGDIGALMLFFGVLGMTGIRDIKKKVYTPDPTIRIRDHIQGTIISGIAAYTAFLSFGGRTILGDILPGSWQILPWILPTLFGVIYIRLKKYKLMIDKKEASS